MGKMQRRKGATVERLIVNMHRDAGIRAERVPMSGASEYTHDADIDVYPNGRDAPFVCEVKARAKATGWATIKGWLGDNDALFLKENRHDPLVVIPWSRWVELIK